MPRRSRPLCYVTKGKDQSPTLVETCTRTIHGLPLLTPGPEADERIVGVLGRAAEYYGVDIHAFGFTGTHYHVMYSTDHGLQMSRFQGHLNSNIAREIGRLHGCREKFWSRRYRPMSIAEDRASQPWRSGASGKTRAYHSRKSRRRAGGATC